MAAIVRRDCSSDRGLRRLRVSFVRGFCKGICWGKGGFGGTNGFVELVLRKLVVLVESDGCDVKAFGVLLRLYFRRFFSPFSHFCGRIIGNRFRRKGIANLRREI